MASGGQLSAGKLTCAICLERFRRPKLLPCFHTFCQTCVESLAPPPAPSFYCPVCRSLVVVPPGGAADLQTNFYLEEDLLGSRESPSCDVCPASASRAEYKCVECEQFYCSSCRAVHDKITSSLSHTLLSCATVTDSPAQKKEQEINKKCPKHKDQDMLFFCTVCSASVCLHCKLTSHEGHATEDVSDKITRARQRLQCMLGVIQRRMRELEVQEDQIQKTKKQLQVEGEEAESTIRRRAEEVIKWAEQARDEEVSGVRKIVTNLAVRLSSRLDRIANRHAALASKADHVSHMLTRASNTDVIKLDTELDVDIADEEAECEKVESGDTARHSETGTPTLLLHCDGTALSRKSVLCYVGHVTATELIRVAPSHLRKPLSLEDSTEEDVFFDCTLDVDNPDTTGSSQQSDSAAQPGIGAFGSTLAAASATEPSKRKPLSQLEDIPQELCYSTNSQSVIVAMCLTVENKLWVKYRPRTTDGELLTLFDEDGSRLITVHICIPGGDSLACVGNVVLSPRDWNWVDQNGDSGCLENSPNDWALCSKSLPVHVLLRDAVDNKQYDAYLLQQTSPSSPFLVKLSHLCRGIFSGDETPRTFDVSADGQWFVYLLSRNIELYFRGTTTGCAHKFSAFSYMSLFSVASCIDICFQAENSKETLLVSESHRSSYDRLTFTLRRLDYKDGFVERDSVSVYPNTTKLAAHEQGPIWRGTNGGKVFVMSFT